MPLPVAGAATWAAVRIMLRVLAKQAAKKAAAEASKSVAAEVARVGLKQAAREGIKYAERVGYYRAGKEFGRYVGTKVRQAVPAAVVETGVTVGLVEVQARLRKEKATEEEITTRSVVTGAVKGAVLGGIVGGVGGATTGAARGATRGAAMGAAVGVTRGLVTGKAAAEVQLFGPEAYKVSKALDAQDPMAAIDKKANLRAKAFDFLEKKWQYKEPYTFVPPESKMYEEFVREVPGGDKLGRDEFSMVYAVVMTRKRLIEQSTQLNRLIGSMT